LLSTLGKEAAALLKPGKAAIISDSHVWPLYGKEATESLEKAGFETVHFVFPAGEASKTGAFYLDILNFLAENQVTRTDCIIALGGGVVGDMSGFVAATFLRGIAYIQVPTTLLAAVDSSVGGVVSAEVSVGDVSSGGAVVSAVVASVASVSVMLSVAPISAADTFGIIPKHRTNTNRNEINPRKRLVIEKSFPVD
jgi:3-dehydroquinate synthase